MAEIFRSGSNFLTPPPLGASFQLFPLHSYSARTGEQNAAGNANQYFSEQLHLNRGPVNALP